MYFRHLKRVYPTSISYPQTPRAVRGLPIILCLRDLQSIPRPVTVTLVDTRNQETFFRMDIPAQKQLTFKFIEGSGSGARGEPTKMYWEVWEAKTEFGSLKNELICPPASCRRIDVTYRTAPEDPPVDPTLLIPPDGQPSPDGPNSVAGGPQPNGKPKD